MNNKEVENTADICQLSQGGAFKVRNAMLAGILTHILSIGMLIFSAIFFAVIIKNGEIKSWKLPAALLMTVYSLACLVSSISFNVFGKFINIRINGITGDSFSAWFDRRIVATYKGFTKEFEIVLKKSLSNNEIFFVKLHQALRGLIKNEPITWLVQFLLSPFTLVPILVNSIFLPHRKALAIKAIKEEDDIFKLANADAKDFVEERFSDEDELFKEIFVVLFSLYNMLRRGCIFDEPQKNNSKIFAFLDKYNIQGINTLYIGDDTSVGNIERLVFTIFEAISKFNKSEISFGRKMEIAEVFKMELALKYIEEGEEALILHRSDYAVERGIQKLCFVVLFPASITFMVLGLSMFNVNWILVGMVLFGGAVALLATKFCLSNLGNIRFKGFKILSVLYLRKKYREKLSREILADIESGVIQSEYKAKYDGVLAKLEVPLEEELPSQPKIKREIHLYEDHHITKEI